MSTTSAETVLDLTRSPPSRRGRFWSAILAAGLVGAGVFVFLEHQATVAAGSDRKGEWGAPRTYPLLDGVQVSMVLGEGWIERDGGYVLASEQGGSIRLSLALHPSSQPDARKAAHLSQRDPEVEALFDRHRWLDREGGLGVLEVAETFPVPPPSGVVFRRHLLWTSYGDGVLEVRYEYPSAEPMLADHVEHVIATLSFP